MVSCLVLLAGGTGTPARAQNDVYAVEFNTGNNRFGILNLLDGSFTQIASLGGALYNDIACAPDGTLFGLADSGASLVVFDKTTGAVNIIASLNVPGLESIAFAPDGTLFGAAQTGLYIIDPTTGASTFIGGFGSPYNLNMAQNIRFDSDGNLYLSNTGDNTDIYRVDTNSGAAMLVGEVAGYPDLVLENGGQYMYGVSVPTINGGSSQPALLAFDLNSFAPGGTNSDGSIHQISVMPVGAGGNFPMNFNFSGSVTNPLPPWTPQPGRLALTCQPDGCMQIQLSGENTQTYVLEASFDLHNWTAIATNVTDAEGICLYLDSDATNYPVRYYRGFTPAR